MSITTTRVLALLGITGLLAACGPSEPQTLDGDDLAGLSLTHAQDAAIVYVVNHPTTTLDVLDTTIGLDSRAAYAIIKRRNGKDGKLGTADDQPFTTVSDLDSVPYLGPAGLDRLRAFAIGDEPWTESADEGRFSALEAAVIVFGVNQADLAELDYDVPLNATAARNLVDNAPYATVGEIAAVPYVGPAALQAMLDYSINWRALLDGGPAPLAGTFDNVAFDETQARIALDIANYADGTQLKSWGGLRTQAANLLLNNRPFANVDEIADVVGIGEGTMRTLRDYAASRVWPNGPCGASFSEAQPLAVVDYATGIAAFDPADPVSHWTLSAWQVPSCMNVNDSDTRGQIEAHALDIAGWTSSDKLLLTKDLGFGSSHFESELAKSLADMAAIRDAYLANGETWAEEAYNDLAASNAGVSALVTANPSHVFEMSNTLADAECTQYQAIVVDLKAGLLLEIRKGPSC